MNTEENTTTKSYGKLTFVSVVGTGARGERWLLQCTCGRTRELQASRVTSGKYKSCGHCHWLDLKGKRFGRLLVLEKSTDPHSAGRGSVWLCQCDCGKVHKAYGKALNSGQCNSCGCLQADATREALTTHGHTDSQGFQTKEYRTWAAIKTRCYNPSAINYCYYGALGVTMCETWQNSFQSFLEHVGYAPTPKHTIDRIDPFGNYVPGNVHWATPKAQRANQRRCFDPEKLTNRIKDTLAILSQTGWIHASDVEKTMLREGFLPESKHFPVVVRVALQRLHKSGSILARIDRGVRTYKSKSP